MHTSFRSFPTPLRSRPSNAPGSTVSSPACSLALRLAGASARTPRGSAPLTPLTILFGSQTGTAEGLAKRAAKEAGKRGFAATVLDMAQTDLAKLAAEKNLLVIISTYGDGEPPDNAKALHAALAAAAQARTASLASLPLLRLRARRHELHAVLQVRQRLRRVPRKTRRNAHHAARRLRSRLRGEIHRWLDAALVALGSAGRSRVAARRPPSPNRGSSLRPKRARLLEEESLPGAAAHLAQSERRRFRQTGSSRRVRSSPVPDSVYEAGDALGVFAHNCPALVGDVLAALGCDGEEAVPAPDGSTTSLRRALTELYDLGKPLADLLALSTRPTAGRRHAAVRAPSRDRRHSRGAGVKLAPDRFRPRAEATSAAPLFDLVLAASAHAGQVHLTVGAVRYENARPRRAKASARPSSPIAPQPGDARVGVFVHSNKAFRPPAERRHADDHGRAGHGHRAVPRVSPRAPGHRRAREELALLRRPARRDRFPLSRRTGRAARATATLTRLDTAFSRDQAEKIYVQHRMLENAAELYAWLEAGAHFYVCGDASRMAKDVDVALHQVIERAGGKTAEQAAAYVQTLKAAKRYARDVY